MNFNSFAALAASWLLFPASAGEGSSFKLDSSLLQDHAVIQRGSPLTLSGTGGPNNEFVATIGDHSTIIQANGDGEWNWTIPPMEATTTPFTITFQAGEETLALYENLLVGDVWVCSGQSNMYFDLQRSEGGTELITEADPLMRLFYIAPTGSGSPQVKTDGNWVVADHETTASFSGVGVAFAHHLRQHSDVPIGLVQSAYGGTPVESWLSPWAHDEHGALEYSRRQVGELLADYPELYENFDEDYILAFQEFEQAREEWRTKIREGADRNEFRRPGQPGFQKGGKHIPTVLYNGMIHPLTTWPISGVIWYQGESNSNYHREHYRSTMGILIEDWRARWNQPEMPFLMVQLANFRALQEEAGERSNWADIRWSQFMVTKDIVNTYLATAIDLGEADLLHPRDKIPIGNRLARLVRRHVMGETSLTANGPIASAVCQDDSWIDITFSEFGEGLRLREGTETLKGFEVACQKGEFHFLEGTITGSQTVRLELPAGLEATVVRYAWADNPIGNLTNETGIAALPFTMELDK